MSTHDPQLPFCRVTALKKYDRLESPGLWRETAGARGLDVVVGLREATLLLSDPKSDLALTHWSLPAVQRLNPGDMPARYAPDPEAGETLEIDDPDMIAALDTVRRVLARRRVRPGRLRGLILTGATLLVVGSGLIWVPDALITHTASVLPLVTRVEIGHSALADVTRLTGPPCAGRLGTRAAALLAERLFAPEPVTLLVVQDALKGSIALPGGLILLGREVVETPPGVETAAGFALAASMQAAAQDPVLPLLRYAGVPATLRLLTTGALPPTALDGYAEVLLRRETPILPTETMLDRFAKAGVPTSPFAYALDPSGETVLGLIEADPFRNGPSAPILADGDWISLQAICAK